LLLPLLLLIEALHLLKILALLALLFFLDLLLDLHLLFELFLHPNLVFLGPNLGFFLLLVEGLDVMHDNLVPVIVFVYFWLGLLGLTVKARGKDELACIAHGVGL
jgi:hypothetical protein